MSGFHNGPTCFRKYESGSLEPHEKRICRAGLRVASKGKWLAVGLQDAFPGSSS